VALAGVPSVGGCSAVAALAETHRAERALVSTHGLRSTPAANYALTLGHAYLDKAREEAAEAHYGRAVVYARAATAAAHDAQRTQVERITSGMIPAPLPVRKGAAAGEVRGSAREQGNEGEGSR
jgi:hypothetical protein